MLLPGGVVLAVGVASFMRAPLLPEIGRDLGIGAAELAFLTTAFAVGRLAMDLPAGRVADRLPPGLTLAGSGLGVAASALILGTAHSFVQALAGMFFLGAASSLTNTTGMTLFATSAPAARRGAAMAAFSMALMTGQTLGPGVGGLISGLGGWRLAQAVAVGIGVGVTIVCLTARGAREATAVARHRDTDDNGDAAGLTQLQAAALAAVPFAVFFTMGALPQTLIPLIGSDDLALSASAIGLALAAGGAVRFAGSAVAGAISDRVSRKAALVPSMLIMAGAVAILAVPPTLTTWLLAIVLISTASSGIAVAATIIADNVPAATVGRRLGTFRFTGDFGLLAGPAVTGLLYQETGRASAMLVTAAVVAVTGVAAMLIVPGARA
jgi:DHA1 family multidrug resistance protein-like MFS transporter